MSIHDFTLLPVSHKRSFLELTACLLRSNRGEETATTNHVPKPVPLSMFHYLTILMSYGTIKQRCQFQTKRRDSWKQKLPLPSNRNWDESRPKKKLTMFSCCHAWCTRQFWDCTSNGRSRRKAASSPFSRMRGHYANRIRQGFNPWTNPGPPKRRAYQSRMQQNLHRHYQRS